MMPDQARRAYIHHGVENPALSEATYPARMTPATIERAAVEKTKALLAGTIAKGRSGNEPFRIPREMNKRSPAQFWRAGRFCTDSPCCRLTGSLAQEKRYDKLSDSVVQSILDGPASKLRALPPATWFVPQRSS